MKTQTTLYIADDHQMVIDGLKLLIGNDESIKIIGSANDSETARKDIVSKRPDLVLLDLRMPKEQEGLDLIFSLIKVTKDTKFIILSMHGEQHYMRDAMNGGASGYLLKNAGKEELGKCLMTVLKGDTYFPNLKPVKESHKSLFTPREAQILKLILDGFNTAEIASKLSLSAHTVSTHRKSICHKTGVSDRFEFSRFLNERHIDL